MSSCCSPDSCLLLTAFPQACLTKSLRPRHTPFSLLHLLRSTSPTVTHLCSALPPLGRGLCENESSSLLWPQHLAGGLPVSEPEASSFHGMLSACSAAFARAGITPGAGGEQRGPPLLSSTCAHTLPATPACVHTAAEIHRGDVSAPTSGAEGTAAVVLSLGGCHGVRGRAGEGVEKDQAVCSSQLYSAGP